jgi:O-antigen ligase
MLKAITIDRFGLTVLVYGLIGVAVFLPWRTYFTNMFVVTSAAGWILSFRTNRNYLSKQVLFFVVLLASVYLMEVIGMIHTDNTSYGLHRLESKLSLIVFPIIILASGIQKEELRKILNVFIISTIAACVFGTVVAMQRLIANGQSWSAFFSDSAYSNVALTEPIQRIHPTFLTLFICLAIYAITEHVRIQRKHYGLLLINIFLLFFAFQLASRAGYVALIVTLILIGFGFIGINRKFLMVIYIVVIFAGFIISITTIPTVRTRLVDAVLEADIKKEQVNSVSYHLKTWTCSIESWKNGHILFGYGTGDEVNTITKCYHDKNWVGYGHDAHNEFLSSLVKHGIVGLTVLLIAFFYPFYLAIRYRDLRYATFLTFILICFLSESMLRGQTGLVFYALFNTLFLKDLIVRNGLIKIPAESI